MQEEVIDLVKCEEDCQKVIDCCKPKAAATPTDAEKAAIDPATIIALAQVVMQILKAIRERRQGK